MRVPNLEQMIQEEYQRSMSTVYNKNTCLEKVLLYLVDYKPTDVISQGLLHSYICISLGVPVYHKGAKLIYAILKERYDEIDLEVYPKTGNLLIAFVRGVIVRTLEGYYEQRGNLPE